MMVLKGNTATIGIGISGAPVCTIHAGEEDLLLLVDP
jgi:hypothetical protein